MAQSDLSASFGCHHKEKEERVMRQLFGKQDEEYVSTLGLLVEEILKSRWTKLHDLHAK